MKDYSVSQIGKALIEEIKQALKSVESYGSVEIYVQGGRVTQVTVRNIKKTDHSVLAEGKRGVDKLR